MYQNQFPSSSIWEKVILELWQVPDLYHYNVAGAVVAQLASTRLSEREVPSSMLGDLNVCFDFPLIRVAIALNTCKTEH